MNEKNIIKKLGELKGIGPDKAWKEETRDFLLSEVRSSVFEDRNFSFLDRLLAAPKLFLSAVEERAWAVLLIAVVLVGGGFSAQAASRNARPGDSLYLARVFSERAKVAVTFNKEKKVKLDMRLASDRAKDITEVLAELSNRENGDDKKLAKLSESFKEEIQIVKKNIKEMQINEAAAPEKATEPITASGTDEEGVFGIGLSDSQVRAVESGKDGQGVDIYVPADLKTAEEVSENEAVASSADNILPEAAATTTKEVIGESVDDMLSNAQDSMEANDFASAKVMLETVDQMLSGEQPATEEPKTGEVKGAEEAAAASSTEEIK